MLIKGPGRLLGGFWCCREFYDVAMRCCVRRKYRRNHKAFRRVMKAMRNLEYEVG